MITFRILGPEISIASANSVSNAKVVRVINTGQHDTVMNVAHANGTVYGNCTVTRDCVVMIQKATGDLVVGDNMKATPITRPY
jgi:hypothetical protein